MKCGLCGLEIEEHERKTTFNNSFIHYGCLEDWVGESKEDFIEYDDRHEEEYE